MMFRRTPTPPPASPAPMSEAELLLEHANIMRKLASDMASQHLTLMLVGDGSPMNNLVRDTVGANRRSMEEAADHLQVLARESRLRPPGLTLWPFVLRLGLSFAVGITIAPFTLMALFWAIDQIAPLSPNEKQSAAELHWMEQTERRVAAADANPASSGRISAKIDLGRPASKPSDTSLAPGPYHAAR